MQGLTTASMALANAAGQVLYSAISKTISIFSGAVAAGLQAYATYEMLGMSLQTLAARELVNSGQAATMSEALTMASTTSKELLDWTQKLAIESPFTSEGVSQAFRTAMAYGFTVKESKRLTKAMIDFASGSGASEASMARIALALGQIKARGKLAGGEIMQLTETGIPVIQILAKQFGITTAEVSGMVEKGLIPADAAIEAITRSLETDFSGAAKRSANTFSGLLSSLQDIKTIGLREFFTDTFQTIQPYLQRFVEFVTKPETMEMIRGWGDSLGGLVGKVLGIFDLGKTIATSGILSGDFWRKARTVLGENFTSMLRGVEGLDVGTLIGTVIGNALSGTVINPAKMIGIGLSIMNGITTALVAALPTLVPVVMQMINALITFIGTSLPMLITSGVQIILTLATSILDSIPLLIDTVVQLIPQIVLTIIEALPKIIQAALQIILALARGIIQAIPVLLPYIPTVIKAIFDAIIIALPMIFQAAIELILMLLDGIASMLPTLSKSAIELVGVVVSGITGVVSQLWDAGKAMVEGVWQGILARKTVFEANIKTFFTNIVDGVKKLLGIASPSKLFEGFGVNMMLGLAKGVLEMTVKPVKAVASATQAILAPAYAATSAPITTYNYSPTTNYNLGVTTTQSSQGIQRSFAMMELLAGV